MQREGTGGGAHREGAPAKTSDDDCGERGERKTHVGAVGIIRECPAAQRRDSRPMLACSWRSEPDHRWHASTRLGSIGPIRMEESAFAQCAAPAAIDRAYAGAR